MDGWVARHTPLEYWFFRCTWPSGALLVDLVARRATGRAEVRVSVRHDGESFVVRSFRSVDELTVSDTPAAGMAVTLAGSQLTPQATFGRVDEVAWTLTVDRGTSSLAVPPDPLAGAGAVDLSLSSWPRAVVTGTVSVGTHTVTLDRSAAMLCHYWGRRLPDRWVWLSANDFDDDVAVEASVLTSRAWGVPVPTGPLGYAWRRQGGREELVASPINGLVTVSGESGLLFRVRRPGSRWQVRARGLGSTFVDLGDGIRQSLAADCRLESADGVAIARGSACLELRDLRWARSPDRVDTMAR